MIFGNINRNNHEEIYPKAIQKAINYLKNTDVLTMAVGRYEIDGDNMIVQIIDATTKKRQENRPEVHRNYIDVQYLAKGSERICFYTDMGDNEIEEELLAERDIIFYEENKNAKESYVEMIEGSFAIFFPEDVHIPACNVKASTAIRKVVVKVKIDTL